MAWFQFRTLRHAEAWDATAQTPQAAQLAGGASLLPWTGVIFFGRGVGHLI